MEVKYSFVCDYSTNDISGKLIVIGIFDNINAASFPARHPNFYFVCGLKFQPSELCNHLFTIRVIDSDGNTIGNALSGEINAANGNPSNINLAVNFEGIIFPKPSTYKVELIIDQKNLVCEPINVIKIPS